jgi:hypothetical protein
MKIDRLCRNSTHTVVGDVSSARTPEAAGVGSRDSGNDAALADDV